MAVNEKPDNRLVEPQPGETQPQDAAKMARLYAKKAKAKVKSGVNRIEKTPKS